MACDHIIYHISGGNSSSRIFCIGRAYGGVAASHDRLVQVADFHCNFFTNWFTPYLAGTTSISNRLYIGVNLHYQNTLLFTPLVSKLAQCSFKCSIQASNMQLQDF